MSFSIPLHAQKLLINEQNEKLNTKSIGTDIGKNITVIPIINEHIKKTIIECFICPIDNIKESLII